MAQETSKAEKEVKTVMSSDRRSYFQRLLLSMKDEALKEIASLSRDRKIELDIGENGQSSDDRAANHLGDPSASEKLIRKRKNLIIKVDEALKLVNDGTYGICARCEEPIDEKRLEARPISDLCFFCKERKERKEKQLLGGNGTKRPRLSPLCA